MACTLIGFAPRKAVSPQYSNYEYYIEFMLQHGVPRSYLESLVGQLWKAKEDDLPRLNEILKSIFDEYKTLSDTIRKDISVNKKIDLNDLIEIHDKVNNYFTEKMKTTPHISHSINLNGNNIRK